MSMRITHGATWLLLAAALGLAGCASRPVSAPVVNLTPTPGAAAVPQGYYVVKPGDTLYSIALEHGVDYHDLAHWNRLEDPTKIRVGQLLRVAPPPPPPGVQVGAAAGAGTVQAQPLGAGATGTAPAAAQPIAPGATVSSPKALRLPYSQQNLAMLSKPSGPPAAPAASPAPGQPAATAPQRVAKAAPAPPAGPVTPPSGPVKFIWPAKGKLLAGFSAPTNKGIDIGGKLGAPVLAAAPGRVMYTGSGIRGYGKLIVIKHADGFNSVYAHNKTILVKEGQNVTRGQEIGEIGDTEADTPMLHFEIRKSGKPVDPLKYLPAGQR